MLWSYWENSRSSSLDSSPVVLVTDLHKGKDRLRDNDWKKKKKKG